jgi:hypothetical protein
MIVEVHNHGPLITSTTYWGSEAEAAGKFFASVNAGAIRLLVPRIHRPVIEEFRTCKYVVLSRGPWPRMRLPEAVELLLEDGTESPYALQLSPESFDLLPAEPEAGREWTITVWDEKKGKAHKAVERVCHWRRVPSLPWLKPWP